MVASNRVMVYSPLAYSSHALRSKGARSGSRPTVFTSFPLNSARMFR
ncbi:Uncharacterised protein [Mycobacteroides abscessus subsp. abscessus]|nr:Uncharacterised protein [Mycobacteroides abscessus subsp. abscessus]